MKSLKIFPLLLLLAFLASCGGSSSSGNVVTITGQIFASTTQIAVHDSFWGSLQRFFVSDADAFTSTTVPNANVTICTVSAFGPVALNSIFDVNHNPVFQGVPSVFSDSNGKFSLTTSTINVSVNPNAFALVAGTPPLYLCASSGSGQYMLAAPLPAAALTTSGTLQVNLDPASTAAWMIMCGQSAASKVITAECSNASQADQDALSQSFEKAFSDNSSLDPDLAPDGSSNDLPNLLPTLAADPAVQTALQQLLSDVGSSDTPQSLLDFASNGHLVLPDILANGAGSVPAGFPTDLAAGNYSISVCVTGSGCVAGSTITLTADEFALFANELESALYQVESQCNNQSDGSGGTESCSVTFNSTSTSSFDAILNDVICEPNGNGGSTCSDTTITIQISAV